LEDALPNFYATLASNQEPLGIDFERVIAENIWSLYIDS
jgi:hypothetical protein